MQQKEWVEGQASMPDMFTGEPPVKSAHKTWKNVQRDLAYALGANVHRSWTARLHISQACPYGVTFMAPSRYIASKIETAYFDTLQRLWNKHDLVVPPRSISVTCPRLHTSEPHTGNGKSTSQHLYAIENSNDKIKSRLEQDAQSPLSPPQQASDPVSSQARNSYISAQGLNSAHTPPTTRQTKISAAKAAHDPVGAPMNPHMRNHSHALDQIGDRSPSRTPSERFTFDSFVVGACNELAHAVARKLATSNDMSYNPVLFHGSNGMGKTHLLHAIKNHIESLAPESRVNFITAEHFVSSFITSVRTQGREAISAFKASLRDVDILIIDDVHFIADKPSSQEEFLHTLVSLIDTGRQVILASDRHPDKIEKAVPRLKSYLTGGLVCKLSAPDFDLRRKILNRLIKRREANGLRVSAIPEQARDLLAARVNRSPRDLVGVFNQIMAQAEYLGRPVSLETVKDTLTDSQFNGRTRLTVDRIQRLVAEEFKISLEDMSSKRRARVVARPRQIAMYLCKKHTRRSLPDIGRRFGGRDHTTVMHAVRRIEELMFEDDEFSERIEILSDMLKG